MKTAIVERNRIGGTCVNVGCTPTKTMVASARVAYLPRRSSDYGVDSRPVTVSMSAVRFRRFGSQVTIVHHLLSVEDPDVADEVARILEEDGVRVLLALRQSSLMDTMPP